jgi:very-short-patch-repair endonuclease
MLWQVLRNRQLDGFRFRRQCPLGNYVVDFFCPSAQLVIELDGETHDENRAAYDARRSDWLGEQKHLRVVRVSNQDVRQNLQGVYELIRQELRRAPPPDLPRSQKRSRGRNLGP